VADAGVVAPSGAADGLAAWVDAPTDVRLVLGRSIWRQLMAWATATDLEVSGMGLLEIDGDDLRLLKVYLLPQVANEVETRLDPAPLAGLVVDLVQRDVDPASLRVWWHSHARETPFWSGLDEHTIAGFEPASMVSLVIDHRGRRLARLDTFAPRRTRLLEVVELERADDTGGEVAIDPDAARKEVERAVRAMGEIGRLAVRRAHG
jgi:hypothetical protein